MNAKTLMQINLTIGIILSFYFSIKGSMNYGWFSCMGLSKIYSCSFISWIIQIIVLVLLFTVILIGIEYGAKYLFTLLKKKPKEEKKEVKETPKKEAGTQIKSGSSQVEEKKEEPKKKKVIKI